MGPTQTSPVPGPDGRTYTVFAHLNADKASLYRDILGTFVAERARFALALRPSEIQAALATGILRRAHALGLTESDAIAVCRTALSKPGAARTLVDEAATELAIHVAILANALDPTLVVLGGGLGCAAGRYWSSFRAALPRHTCGPHMRHLRVRRARLGTMAGTIGAALCALEAPWR